MINIVLYQPEIPPNTGNIARLCACNDFYLHIVHPAGFSLSQKEIKRAGLDYWDNLQMAEHASWDEFLSAAGPQGREKLHFFSSRATTPFWQGRFSNDCYLIFGSETTGLPESIHREFSHRFLTIPMVGKDARCLNLSNSASIASYEVIRQQQKYDKRGY